MLVSNSRIAVGEVWAFKLVNGDEVVARVAEITPDEYLLDRPCVVVGGAKGIGLIQAMFSLALDKKVPIKSEHVMMMCEAMDQMRDHYLETTTGIKPVSKPSIIV